MFDDLKVTSCDDRLTNRITTKVPIALAHAQVQQDQHFMLHSHAIVVYILINVIRNIIVLTLGQWTVPSVSGQCCPPTESFIIEKISRNKGIMFGGVVTDGNWNTATNSVYLYQLSHNTMVS